MFGSVVLEVIIGIIFINILVSTICSTIREGIEAWVKTRAAYLERSIRELLKDKEGTGMASAMYNHPLVYSLFSGDYTAGKKTDAPGLFENGKNLPSYIPSANFAIALMDIAAKGASTDAVSSDPGSPVISLSTIRNNILNIDNVQVQRALLTAIDTAQGDLNTAQANIENWYNGSMDRVSGWYKRSTFWIIFWIGLVVSVVFNINTITLADYLYRNDGVRTALVKRAETMAKDSTVSNQDYDKAKAALESLSLPIGWSNGWGAPKQGESNGIWNGFFGPILGWLLTALAATLGAPFWFDMLNKVSLARSTVKPAVKSADNTGDGNQPPKKQQVVTDSGNAGLQEDRVPAILPGVRDKDSNVDGCDVVPAPQDETDDKDLPAAEGGVA